jgi:hypothetical protein
MVVGSWFDLSARAAWRRATWKTQQAPSKLQQFALQLQVVFCPTLELRGLAPPFLNIGARRGRFD